MIKEELKDMTTALEEAEELATDRAEQRHRVAWPNAPIRILDELRSDVRYS